VRVDKRKRLGGGECREKDRPAEQSMHVNGTSPR
jgi:hypothetical protein